MREDALYEHLSWYLRQTYPNVLYHFDLSGVNNPSHRTRNLYARLNRRAWPDVFIAKPVGWDDESPAPTYAGLFLELKTDRVRVKKKDGSWSTPHIAEQALVLEALAAQGYIAQFACGLADAKKLIDSYMEAA